MSAYIVEDEHIHSLIRAGLKDRRGYGPLAWYIGERAETDYEAGEPWGPTQVESATNRRRELTEETADRVGRMLLKQNHRSVNFRYAESDPEDRLYKFPRPRMIGGMIEDRTGRAPDPSAVAVLKSIGCYEYQSCENPEWEDSEAAAFCDALRHKEIARLAGWSEANWGPAKDGLPEARRGRG